MRGAVRLHLIEVVPHKIEPVHNVGHRFERQVIQVISVTCCGHGKKQVSSVPEGVQTVPQLFQKEDEIVLVVLSLVVGGLPTGDGILPIDV